MKAIFVLLLLLAASGCDKPKREARADDYRDQSAVEAAHSTLASAVEGVNRQAFNAHNEWMRVETIKLELKVEQRPKEMAALSKELKEATTANAEAEEVYASHVQRIEAAARSGRALLNAAAKPKSRKLLETEVDSAERLLVGLVDWRKRSDAAAIKFLETMDPEQKHEAQREYYKISKQHGELK